ncbi:MAG TPA: START domain-containing protein [Polyangiales bacterium]|nr:START domain-containing protein [Polyangiales bacterium]
MRNLALRTFPFLAALCLFALSASAIAATDNQWKFIDEDDGIHTWMLEIPGQDLPGFRGQTVINASAKGVLDRMLNWREHTKWMYRCAESTLLEMIDGESAYLYNRTSAPWPVWDRDVVVKSLVEHTPSYSEVKVSFANVDYAKKPPKDDVVRMPKLVGFYKMWQLEPNKTKVLYQVEADIGGSIPKWLAKRAARDLPYTTLLKLRERVEGKK